MAVLLYFSSISLRTIAALGLSNCYSNGFCHGFELLSVLGVLVSASFSTYRIGREGNYFSLFPGMAGVGGAVG